ncbi:hypothetical protein RvY_18835-2 [Ramazzottius varieornatus]|uniref:Tc1-like transposase DDE domain-containing protein n=1 Tax=Ramazzottius varieornatus TaxID=947166 RepID=A0A1D1W7G3_RAMVA|nr:hypothetical protein RvY_18835-2 [Ramazzottius varieornatus]
MPMLQVFDDVMINSGCYGFRFMKEVVVPRLKEFARLHGYDTVVIVLDNASYHSRLMPQFRRSKRVKKEIQQWLTDHRIEFGARELVAELWRRVAEGDGLSEKSRGRQILHG